MVWQLLYLLGSSDWRENRKWKTLSVQNKHKKTSAIAITILSMFKADIMRDSLSSEWTMERTTLDAAATWSLYSVNLILIHSFDNKFPNFTSLPTQQQRYWTFTYRKTAKQAHPKGQMTPVIPSLGEGLSARPMQWNPSVQSFVHTSLPSPSQYFPGGQWVQSLMLSPWVLLLNVPEKNYSTKF